VAQGSAAQGNGCAEQGQQPEKGADPPPPPSLSERLADRAARIGQAVRTGYGCLSEGIESALDSEAMRTAVKPFLYAFLVIGMLAPH
jgi:hypothetical protein